MTFQLSEEDLKEVRAAVYWAWAKDNPEEAAARLGCGLVTPVKGAHPPKAAQPRRRSWRNPGGSAAKRSQAHMRRLRRFG